MFTAAVLLAWAAWIINIDFKSVSINSKLMGPDKIKNPIMLSWWGFLLYVVLREKTKGMNL